MTAVWDDRLLPKARAQSMAAGWPWYQEIHVRCKAPAYTKDDAQRGDRICGQSMGVITFATTEDEWVAMIVRHMVMAHDRKLSGSTDD
jgi:hypothetical protein